MTTDPTASLGRTWTLLTNHGRLLLLIASNPQARLRDLADRAGITERAASSIVADLEAAGYVTRSREGRRNVYEVHADRPFRHPAEAGHEVGELLGLFGVRREAVDAEDASGGDADDLPRLAQATRT